MAIFKPGPLISEARGKVGGIVFARNKGGMYIRNFAAPTQGQFEAREEAKAAFGYLANLWGGLTQIQRDGWTGYGQAVPAVNALGEEHTITGLAAFLRGNSILRRAGAPIAENPPDAGVRGPTLGTPGVSFIVSEGPELDEMSVTFSSADPYGSAAEAILQTQVSPAVTPARESPSGLPMRFIAAPDVTTNGPGNASDFGDSLFEVVIPGQTYWFRFRLVTLDGRVGPDRYVRATVPTA